MESKSILVGLIVGLVVGGFLGFIVVPPPDVAGLEAQIEQLEQQVSALQNEKNTLQTALQAKDSEIITLYAHISQLEGKIMDLKNQIQTLTSQTNFTFIDVSFTRIEDTSLLLQYWIGRANETIIAMVMLITQDELADALIQAHNRGIEIDIIIDDDWLYSSGSEYQDLLYAGIDIRGDNRGDLMHHKVMIIDGYVVVTGSYNWSASAEDRNDENIIILKSENIAKMYMEEFNRLWAQT